MLFFHTSHTSQPPIFFCYYRRLERFKVFLDISKIFGLRSGAKEILTIILLCMQSNFPIFIIGGRQSRLPVPKRKHFQFEEPDITLNGTMDSEDTSYLEPDNPGFDALSHGKILFAECDDDVIDLDNIAGLTTLEAISRHFEVAENSLFTCWKLAVSFSDLWNSEADTTTKYVTHNFVKLFSIILDFPNMEEILNHRQLKPSTAQNPRLFYIVNTFKKIMELLRFDIINQHLMPPALKFVHHTLELVLNNRELHASDPRIKTLSGGYALLKFAESILNRVYVWVPKSSAAYTGLPLEVRGQQRHAYEPAILMKAHLSPRSVAREIIYTDPRNLGLDQQSQLPGKRYQSFKYFVIIIRFL